MRIIERAEIERAVSPAAAIAAVESAFAAYSRGEVVLPPVGYLRFEDPRAIRTSSTAIGGAIRCSS